MERLWTESKVAVCLMGYYDHLYAAGNPKVARMKSVEAQQLLGVENPEPLRFAEWNEPQDLLKQLADGPLRNGLLEAARELGIGLSRSMDESDINRLVEYCGAAWQDTRRSMAYLLVEDPLLIEIPNPLRDSSVIRLIIDYDFDRRSRVPGEEELFGCTIDEMLE